MKITPIQTRRVHIHDNLFTILEESLPQIKEGDILAISSKIISLSEGSVVPLDAISKDALIKQEADAYVRSEQHGVFLTKKCGLLIPSAGIDESNVLEHYVLYPRDLVASVNALGLWLKARYAVQELGVIITDSHTTPRRRGVLGIGLCWYGFSPLYSYVGKPDCFGRPLQMTQVNLVDALSVAAVLCMGEGNESTPLALIEDAPKISFHQKQTTQADLTLLGIEESEDLYGSLLRLIAWEQ